MTAFFTQYYGNSIRTFREVISLFSQGREKLKAFFEKVWKKIVEWFKKNKDVFGRLKELMGIG